MKFWFLAVCLTLIALALGCGGSKSNADIVQLRSEVNELRSEIGELKGRLDATAGTSSKVGNKDQADAKASGAKKPTGDVEDLSKLSAKERSNLEAEKDFDAPRAEPQSGPVPSSSGDTVYVGSVNSNKFHFLWCSSANRINAENLVTFSSRQEAIDAGRVPCKRCNP